MLWRKLQREQRERLASYRLPVAMIQQVLKLLAHPVVFEVAFIQLINRQNRHVEEIFGVRLIAVAIGKPSLLDLVGVGKAGRVAVANEVGDNGLYSQRFGGARIAVEREPALRIFGEQSDQVAQGHGHFVFAFDAHLGVRQLLSGQPAVRRVVRLALSAAHGTAKGRMANRQIGHVVTRPPTCWTVHVRALLARFRQG